MEGNLDYVKFLIKRGWDIHYLDDLALCWACRNARDKVVKFLIDSGANVHANEEYPIKWAVICEVKNKKTKYENIVGQLIKAGANIHIKSETPLQTAIEKEHTNMVKILLDAGADAHSIQYVLQWAAFRGSIDIVKLLIDAGINSTNEVIQSAIDTTKNKNIAKLLKLYKDDNGRKKS
jgi:ankyrin repeat protein